MYEDDDAAYAADPRGITNEVIAAATAEAAVQAAQINDSPS